LNGTSTIDSVSFEWYNDTTLIGTGPTVEIISSTPTCYTLVGIDTLGCKDQDLVCLTPTFFNLSISENASICLGDDVTLCVTNMAPGQNLSYDWSPTGDHTPCITVQPEDTTTYTAIVTNDDLGCKDTLSAEVVVNIIEPIDIVITAIPDTINVSETSQLFVSDSTFVSYIWTSSGGDQVSSVWNPNVKPTDPGDVTYTVTVTNSAGCTATASITIRVLNPPCNEEDIFLPNAFTPNDDGFNDILFVRSQVVATIDLHIYNRWGQEVFQTNSTNIGWDGKYRGARLAPDVFGYYMSGVCVNGRSFKFKGNITLLE
jgi:gliding motility-associated-like protein